MLYKNIKQSCIFYGYTFDNLHNIYLWSTMPLIIEAYLSERKITLRGYQKEQPTLFTVIQLKHMNKPNTVVSNMLSVVSQQA